MGMQPAASTGLNGHGLTTFFSDISRTLLDTNLGKAIARPLYYPRLDVIIMQNASNQNERIICDPLLVSHLKDQFPLPGTANGTDIKSVGEWDESGGTQKIYGIDDALDEQFTLLHSAGASPLLSILDADPFGSAMAQDRSRGSSALIGYHLSASRGIQCLFFETAGYVLIPCTRVRHTDNVEYDLVLAQVDLTTTLADPGSGTGVGRIVSEIPCSYIASPHQFQSGPVFGHEIWFTNLQFVADDDNVLATPKGLLVMTSAGNPQASRVTTGTQTNYVKIVEWNSSNIAATPGNPSRVHGRELFFSRFSTEQNTLPSGGGMGAVWNGNANITYHPPTNSFRQYEYDAANVTAAMSVHFATPVLDAISEPVPQSIPQTGRTVIHAVSASGDIGEPIAGVGIDWTLQRASTFEELVDTSSGAGPPYDAVAVANLPVDIDGFEIRYLGTLLVEGVDYDWDTLTTGVLEFIGSHAPPALVGYTVTYRHRSSPTTPPHGTLLNAFSKTDVNGLAVTRVQYADDDDLVGAIDVIDRSQAL